MIKGKTESGFEFEISDSARNNMELLDALVAMTANDVTAMSKIGTLLLGEEQRLKLYEHLRTKEGNVPVDKYMAELEEMMKVGEEGKNS